ncbi:hypothetical protein [Sphingomonas endolithica]|uniref:hypothetical protein n=1 Tax=Sphingomonas endolithica TaxID=2972485 RepID=UPI0021B03C3D|nr:hypothetical protein [Sphingomonas sp. ZFBP2030]
MDLSFTRFEHDAPLVTLPSDLAVIMVGIVARQAASPTALSQSALLPPVAEDLLSPAHGAFNADVAALLAQVDEE